MPPRAPVSSFVLRLPSPRLAGARRAFAKHIFTRRVVCYRRHSARAAESTNHHPAKEVAISRRRYCDIALQSALASEAHIIVCCTEVHIRGRGTMPMLVGRYIAARARSATPESAAVAAASYIIYVRRGALPLRWFCRCRLPPKQPRLISRSASFQAENAAASLLFPPRDRGLLLFDIRPQVSVYEALFTEALCHGL